MKWFLNVIVYCALAALLLPGCAPKNPAAPENGNNGTQTVYTFTVTPGAPQGIYAAACPALIQDSASGVYSTVVCSVSRNTGLNASLPLEAYPEGGGYTNYYFTAVTGQVNLVWNNDHAYVPPAFTLSVTVVNK